MTRASGLLALLAAASLGGALPAVASEQLGSCRPSSGSGGGILIPGTQTCLRIYGQARFDYRQRQQFFRTTAPTGFRSGMTFGLDAVSPTEFGAMRAVAQVTVVNRAGEQRNATAIRQGFALDGDFGGLGGPPGALRGGGAELLYTGFIQMGGFTAGRTISFFDPFFVPDIIGTSWRAAPVNVNLIAYTATLGQGLTATLSLEDPSTRRQPILNASAGRTGFNYIADQTNLLRQGGIGLPHLVGALQFEAGWGSAKAATVLTNLRPADPVIRDTRYGFAAIGAVRIRLPVLAQGSTLALLASYGEGALQYSFATFQLGSTALQTVGGAGWSFGDGAFDAASGRLRLTRHALLAAGYQHVWSPRVSSTIFASWRRYDVPFDPVDGRDGQRDGTILSAGANLIWSPVPGLSFAGEGAYVRTDPRGRVPDVNRGADFLQGVRSACDAALSNCRSISAQGNWLAHLRILRDF